MNTEWKSGGDDTVHAYFFTRNPKLTRLFRLVNLNLWILEEEYRVLGIHECFWWKIIYGIDGEIR